MTNTFCFVFQNCNIWKMNLLLCFQVWKNFGYFEMDNLYERGEEICLIFTKELEYPSQKNVLTKLIQHYSKDKIY